MSVIKYDMLLFCKQAAQSKRVLYFVELDTLDDVQPRVHRFTVPARRFREMQLGQVFRLEARGIRIVRAVCEGDYELSQSDYELLLELLHMRFGSTKARFDPLAYFRYYEMQDLLDYHEPLARRALLAALRAGLFLLCGMVPLVLYAVLIAASFLWSEGGISGFSGPILALGALPFMIYLVVLLYTACGAMLLEWKVTRYGMLRSYALKTCGRKRRLGVPRARIVKLTRIGAVCFGLFLLTAVASLFV